MSARRMFDRRMAARVEVVVRPAVVFGLETVALTESQEEDLRGGCRDGWCNRA